jgi:hypothetical protein
MGLMVIFTHLSGFYFVILKFDLGWIITKSLSLSLKNERDFYMDEGVVHVVEDRCLVINSIHKFWFYIVRYWKIEYLRIISTL